MWKILCRSNPGIAEDRSWHSPGRSEYMFPCWSGCSYTSVSSKSFEVCLCHWGGIVHASYSITLWPSQWLTLKDGLNPSSPLLHLLLSHADTCQKDFFFFLAFPDSSLHLNHQLPLSKPLPCPHLMPMTCKSVPLISLWRDREWSGEASCPQPPPSPPPPHPLL